MQRIDGGFVGEVENFEFLIASAAA